MLTYSERTFTDTHTDYQRAYQQNVAEAARDAEIIEQVLPVRLTDAEVLDRGRRVAELSRERAQAEAEKKMAMLEFKHRIETAERDMAELLSAIHSGNEWRSIQCEKVTHRDIGEVTITRLDMGAIVETRPMTNRERQVAMDLED